MKQQTPKHLKVTHKHRKSYRKRHYAVMIASFALGVALINSVILYINNQAGSTQLAKETISEVFGTKVENNSVVRSTYGFSLSYDQRKLSAAALDASNGELYTDQELSVPRTYSTVRLSTKSIDSSDGGATKISYYADDDTTTTDLGALEQTYITRQQTDRRTLRPSDSTIKTVEGVEFRRTEWTRQLQSNDISLSTRFVSYVGIVHDRPMTVVVHQGLSNEKTDDSIINGLSFSEKKQASTVPMIKSTPASLALMDTLLGVQSVGAAAPSYSASERVSATYGAAVVKLYNIKVGDLAIDGKRVIKDHVAGGTGSGFIVSGDGYIATNGHVAVIDPREEVVTSAIKQAQAGNNAPFSLLIQLSGARQSDIANARSDSDIIKILIRKIYQIPSSRFTFQNSKQNLLVGLGNEQISVTDLYNRTLARQDYPTSDTVKVGTLKRADYDGIILPSVLNQFTRSDVALVKIDGKNFPMVRLGSLQSAAQGSNLNIMGFPGVGASNGIVSETKTSSTLTTGKVSALKTDTGGHNLIETDTEIGHGNSGGPAFSDNGEVVGIATYAIDPGGAGDGKLNYIRDIKDFKEIASDEGVTYAQSKTQDEWDKALELFYEARYKRSLTHFASVQAAYPQHPRVAELAKVATTRIEAGENVDDFPLVLVAGATLLVVIGAIGSGAAIVVHRKKHRALSNAIAAGTAQPTMRGAPAQYVSSVSTSSADTPPSQVDSSEQQPQ